MIRSLAFVTALLLAACSGTPASEPTNPTTASRVEEPDAPNGEGEPVPSGVFAGLQEVDDCDALLGYFVDRALEQVGPWGLGHGPGPWPMITRMADAESVDDGGSQAGAEPSTTNVQVEGVDEGDIVKASGDRLFVLSNDRLLVFSTEGESIERLGSLHLAGSSGSDQMLLDGDRLAVVSTGFDAISPPVDTLESDAIAPAGSPVTQITLVDVSNPSEPETLRRLTVDGSAVTTRLVDGHLRVVLEAYPVGLPWAHPEGSGLRAEREATERNREIIRESTIENWLPYYVTDADADGTFIDCSEVWLPPEPSGLGTLSIVSFDMAEGIDEWEAASVVAGGSTVYANPERTYVATSRWLDPAATDSPDSFDGHMTQVHRFDTPVDGPLSYVASGEVEGFLLNQFAMDEYEDHVRVASTTTPGWWGGGGSDSESRVTVLATDGDQLETVGVVDGLGITETIRAVRFMGPVGYVVTFRQTDPLYVIDLSDPSAPVAEGELKIPGYSAYLHPVADGMLLGVGQDADPETGAVHGLQLSLFDVSDPSDPTRLDTFGLEGGEGRESQVWSQVEGDHKAFTAVEDGAFVPYEGWSWSEESETETIRLGLIHVDWSGGSLDGSRVLSIMDGKPTGDEWGFGPHRTVAKGDVVYAIGHAGITVIHLPSGEIVERLPF